MNDGTRYGCIEAGGTKFVLGIVGGFDDIRETHRIPTGEREATLSAASDWLRMAGERHGGLAGLGIASFGPVELDRDAPNWGFITATTKPGWSDTDFAARLGRELALPVGFDTDVNGAALAEATWGAAQGARVSVYLTVGTGIGGGAVIDGTILRGLTHPEMGHIRVPRHPHDDFPGICPFHGDCIEGMASGPAIMARWGNSLSELAADHPGHATISHYLAQLVVTLQSIMEPGRIVMGGGVMATPGLIDRLRDDAARLGGGYFRGNARDIIVPPALGDKAGLLGAYALACNT